MTHSGKNTRVASNGRVVVELQNLAAEAKVGRDVLLTTEVQHGNIIGKGTVPVRIGLGVGKNALGEAVSSVTIGDCTLEIQVYE